MTETNLENRRGGYVEKDPSGGWKVIWNVAKGDDEYIAFAKKDPKEADDRTKNDLGRSRAKAKAGVKRRKKEREVAEAAAKNRRDKMRISKGYLDMKEEPIITLAKAMINHGHQPKLLQKKDWYRNGGNSRDKVPDGPTSYRIPKTGGDDG